jgi:hypothetical protein
MSKSSRRKHGEIVRDGLLRYFAADAFTVTAVTPNGTFKLFKINFGSDGSIYLPFPYLDTKRGVLSVVDPTIEPDPKTVNFRRNGTVVEYDVKFSHHTSGIVQFSRSGKGALPRRQGFRLDGPIGKVFEFQLFHLRGFATLDGGKPAKDVHIGLRFPYRHPTSLRVWGEWRRKSDVAANMENTAFIGARTVGPTATVTRRSDGVDFAYILLGQPKTHPLQDHLLMISAEEIPLADGADTSTAVFLGGWDQHEGAPPQTPRFMSFLYPIFDVAPPSQ